MSDGGKQANFQREGDPKRDSSRLGTPYEAGRQLGEGFLASAGPRRLQTQVRALARLIGGGPPTR